MSPEEILSALEAGREEAGLTKAEASRAAAMGGRGNWNRVVGPGKTSRTMPGLDLVCRMLAAVGLELVVRKAPSSKAGRPRSNANPTEAHQQP